MRPERRVAPCQKAPRCRGPSRPRRQAVPVRKRINLGERGNERWRARRARSSLTPALPRSRAALIKAAATTPNGFIPEARGANPVSARASGIAYRLHSNTSTRRLANGFIISQRAVNKSPQLTTQVLGSASGNHQERSCVSFAEP